MSDGSDPGSRFPDRLLNAAEVGEFLNVGQRWVLDAARRNAIPHIRLGRYVRFRRADIELEFKWGWNPIDREAVWLVDGPGDGMPAHQRYLSTAWGRSPNTAEGDVLGMTWLDAAEAAGEEIVIEAFQEKAVPEDVVAWFSS